MAIEISVIVPVYNVEKYIEKCLNSIIGQTYTNVEVIIVDDGSTDKTAIICDEFAKNDSRIVVYHINNSGASFARNFGINRAKGKWIMFVDGDDWIEQNAIENLLKPTLENDVDIVIASYTWDMNGTLKIASDALGADGFIDISELRSQMQSATIIRPGETTNLFSDALVHLPKLAGPVAKLYKRNSIFRESICFPDGIAYGEDVIFNFRVLKYASTAYFVNIPVYHYVIRSGSACNSNAMILKENCLSYLNLLNSEISTQNADYILKQCYAIGVLIKMQELCQYFGMTIDGFVEFKIAVKQVKDFYAQCANISHMRSVTISSIKSRRDKVIFTLLKNGHIKSVLLICWAYYKTIPNKNRYNCGNLV